MARRGQFTVDAESVQGIAGATVAFRCLKVGTVNAYRTTEMTDADLLEKHVVAWSGIVDDDDKDMASPADDPAVLGELYVHEQLAMVRLLFQGPDGDSAKN